MSWSTMAADAVFLDRTAGAAMSLNVGARGTLGEQLLSCAIFGAASSRVREVPQGLLRKDRQTKALRSIG